MNALQKVLLSIRLVGLGNVVRSIRYARRRDRLDARARARDEDQPAAEPRFPGRLRAAESALSGAFFQFETARLQVRFLSPDLVFIGWNGAGMTPSWAVTMTELPNVDVTLSEISAGEWSVRSRALEVRVGQDGSLRYLDLGGRTIRAEDPIYYCGEAWTGSAALEPDAMICGLGERAARLNLRPGSYRFWNRDPGGSYGPGDDPLYITMPVYLCLQGSGSYLMFYDNTCDGSAVISDRAEIRFTGGPARHYFAVGSPAGLVDRLTALTGRPALPPRWALGYQQSRWGGATVTEMRRVRAGFRRHDLPLSALVLDIDHQRGYRTLTVDHGRLSRLAAFSRELAAEDVHLVAIVGPGVKTDAGFDLYTSGRESGAFCQSADGKPMIGVVWPGWSAFPDFTHPSTRSWWGKQYARLLDQGIDGIWHDMNEPSTFAAWGDGTLPVETRHYCEGRGGDHREAHNVYGLLMNQAGYEGLRALRPDKRPFILSRSGWVGMQRHAWTWTGDTQTSWEMIRATICTVLGLGLCGLPYAGPDIGGFSGSPSLELFARWFELAAFLPFFRTHSAFFLPRREPWEFGREILTVIRRALQLRYRLLPYLYTLARQAHETGAPLARPLFWDDPADQALRAVDDAFLFGDALLVAPVTKEAARTRTVRLPRGTWFDFPTSRVFSGGQAVEMEAPLAGIPLLVRAGSVLPDASAKDLTLHIYKPDPEVAGGGLLYSDAGDGFGVSRMDRFSLFQGPGGFQLSWTREGDFPWPYASLSLHLHGFTADHTVVDGTDVSIRDEVCRVTPFARVRIPG